MACRQVAPAEGRAARVVRNRARADAGPSDGPAAGPVGGGRLFAATSRELSVEMGASRGIFRASLSVSVIRPGLARVRIHALPGSLISLLVLLSSFRVAQRRDFAAAHQIAEQPVQSGLTSDSRPLASLNLGK